MHASGHFPTIDQKALAYAALCFRAPTSQDGCNRALGYSLKSVPRWHRYYASVLHSFNWSHNCYKLIVHFSVICCAYMYI